MIHLSPFSDLAEHREYCTAAGVFFEEGRVGFKVDSDEEKLGLFQIKFVGEAAYVLNISSIDDRISTQMLANVFTSVIEFLKRCEVESIIYPIQTADDGIIAEAVGFDRISETLYVFDFPQESEGDFEPCSCGHDHHHS